jgi:hypothetical protein
MCNLYYGAYIKFFNLIFKILQYFPVTISFVLHNNLQTAYRWRGGELLPTAATAARQPPVVLLPTAATAAATSSSAVALSSHSSNNLQ